MKMNKNHRVYVAGHRGLAGSAIIRELKIRGYSNFVTRTRAELDLMNQDNVRGFFERERPDVVFFAAAKVGGILANNMFRTEFLNENLQIQNNVILAAHEFDVGRLIFLGSSCVYPRDCPQPIREAYLLSGPLEFTNRPYAVAKIAGMEMVHSLRLQHKKDFFSVMPTNLYGPFDNYSYHDAHVIPAMIRKFVEAKENNATKISLFGTGRPRREFMHSFDFAKSLVTLAESVDENYFESASYPAPGFAHINIGLGQDISISDLASLIGRIVGFQGNIEFDATKPDGTPRKLLDVSVLNHLASEAHIDLEEGLRQAIGWFIEHRKEARL